MTEQLLKYMEKLDELPPVVCKSAEEMRELDEKVFLLCVPGVLK